MAITFGTPVEYVDTASFQASKTINLSTDAAAGDYRVVCIAGLPNGTTPGVDSFSVDVPSGWQNIGGNNSSAASDQYLRIVYRKWQSGDADTLTVNFTGGNLAVASICVTVHGADQTTFLDVATPTENRPNANAQWQCPAVSSGAGTDGQAIMHAIVGDGTVGSGLVDGNIPSGDSLIGTTASATPSNGWGLGFSYNINATAVNESAANWGTLNEEHVGFTFVIRPGATEGITGVTPDEFDMDATDVDIEGANFEASQGSGAVYLSDADTLAGSANEVDISSAVNTWADDLVNLDLTQLSAGELSSLQTLGPGARYLILVNNSSDEYSFPVTLHRPHGMEMVLSANFAPGATSQRLTGLTGTFGNGRIEEALNPSTTDTDVASNGNREDVWNIQATPLAREVDYVFRVTVGGVPIDTYTVTPTVTVSAGGPIAATQAESATAAESQSAAAQFLAAGAESGSAAESQDAEQVTPFRGVAPVMQPMVSAGWRKP